MCVLSNSNTETNLDFIELECLFFCFLMFLRAIICRVVSRILTAAVSHKFRARAGKARQRFLLFENYIRKTVEICMKIS